MAKPLLSFEKRERLIDAAMLAGAGLSPCNVGSRLVTISISRMRSQRRILGWLILLMQTHGIRLNLVSDGTSIEEADKLTYKSRGDQFLYAPMIRWYPDFEISQQRQAVTPQSIELDEAMFCVWLANALSSGDGTIRLTGPRMSVHVARRLAWYVRRFGWTCQEAETTSYWNVVIDAEHRPSLETWLEQFVPREIFTPLSTTGA
jgi:hypothetical protein